MFVKSVAEGSSQSTSGLTAVQRATLTVTPPAEAAELPDVAVARSGAGQALPQDQHDINQHSHIIGKLRSSVADALEKRRAMEELDELRAKVLNGGGSDAVEQVVLLGQSHEGDLNPDFLLGSSAEEKARERELKEITGQHDDPRPRRMNDPRSVLSKIDDALGRIDQLKDKLEQSETEAFDRLVSFNVSVSGLNVARTQITDSAYSVSVASAAVESIMTNIRSAVIAHGGTSTEIVRLVLAS